MGTETFYYIGEVLDPVIARQSTQFKKSISTEQRLVVTL